MIASAFWTWFAVTEATIGLLLWVVAFLIVRRLWMRAQPMLAPILSMFAPATITGTASNSASTATTDVPPLDA